MANQFLTFLVLTLTHVLPLRNNKLRKTTRARSSLGEVGKVLWLGFHSFVFDPYQFPLMYLSSPTIFVTKGTALLLVIKRCGHTNRKNEFGPLSNKNTITESLIPSHHSLDLVTRHLLLRPATRLEILHERFPASVAHGTHPTHPRQLYHRTVAAPLFFFRPVCAISARSASSGGFFTLAFWGDVGWGNFVRSSLKYLFKAQK